MIQRRRLVLNVPFFVTKVMAFGFDMVQAVTLGLITNKMLTRDQVNSLGATTWWPQGAKGLADLGIQPTAMDVGAAGIPVALSPVGAVCRDQGIGQEPDERPDPWPTDDAGRRPSGPARRADRVHSGVVDRASAAGRAFPGVSNPRARPLRW